ncbi:MAG: DNA repair protein RadC [Holosporaceae bacterium]|jgi:DNA repair protein RadC|nr:DNA repair protein RadC [Holosporaceae bacterium]
MQGLSNKSKKIRAKARTDSTVKPPDKIKDAAAGHRLRLRNKFLLHPKNIHDYELMEMLLFCAFLRKDTKPMAKNLCGRFRSLRRIIFAEADEIESLKGLGKTTSFLMRLLREIFSRMLLEQLSDSPVVASSSHVCDYYKNILGILKKEQLRIMFLNNKNRLISEDVLQVGTINHTSIYPREILQMALECGASAIIMVHNHPSGDPEPSRQDVLISRALRDIAQKLDVTLLDHLIVGKNNVISMKDKGFI